MDALIRKLAQKHKLDERIVREVVYSPFRFLSKNMKSADTKQVRFKYLFKVKPKTICLPSLLDLQKQ